MMDRNDAHPEVGNLGHAFDAIVQELDRFRKDCEAYNLQLQQRNRELAATAAIAQATSTGQLDLDGRLERALEAEADSSGGLLINPTRLHDLKAIVASTLNSVRDLALGLRASVLDDLGLVPAVRRTVRTFSTYYGLSIDFQTLGLEGIRLPLRSRQRSIVSYRRR
jgi:signal transduction histidine kinase